MTNLDSILKSRDITLPTKVRLVKAMVFPVVLYGCESWAVKQAEHKRIDAFELWCWRRLLRHLFNYKQTKAHRNIWGTDAEALPASFRGYKQSKQDGGVGNTDTGGRSPEMRRGGLVSAPPLVLCYSPAQEQRQRRCSSIIQTGWLAGCHPTLIAHL